MTAPVMPVGSGSIEIDKVPTTFVRVMATVVLPLVPCATDSGDAATVTDAGALTRTAVVPVTLPEVARMVVVPGATEVTTAVAPEPTTPAIAGLSEDQVTVGLLTMPPVVVTCAESVAVAPGPVSTTLPGETATETTEGGGGGVVVGPPEHAARKVARKVRVERRMVCPVTAVGPLRDPETKEVMGPAHGEVTLETQRVGHFLRGAAHRRARPIARSVLVAEARWRG